MIRRLILITCLVFLPTPLIYGQDIKVYTPDTSTPLANPLHLRFNSGAAMDAQATQVVDPVSVSFTPSADHDAVQTDLGATGAVVTAYTLDFVRVGPPGGVAVSLPLGKPTPIANLITFVLPSNIRTTLGVGTFQGVVRVSGPGGEAPSAPSDPFTIAPSFRVPAAAGLPTVTKR